MAVNPHMLPKLVSPAQVAGGLALCVVVGVVIGLLTSDFFLNLADLPEPFTKDPPPATFGQSIFVFLSLLGMVIWPAVLAVLFYVWYYFHNKSVQALQWHHEVALREKRDRETEAKIAAAKASGALDKFKKK